MERGCLFGVERRRMREVPFQLEGRTVFFEKSDADPGKRRRIAGIISTEARDRQKEIIIQKGLDFEPFLTYGWLNDNHSKATDGVVGYPEKVQQFQKGDVLPNGKIADTHCTWMEGYLIEGTSRADSIWELGQALSKSGGSRSLGFSIEGTILKRIGPGKRVVAKAAVQNCAVTNCFPGDVRVLGVPKKVTRRWYEGPMVEVILRSGEKLTGTPNHPVLTDAGWQPLGVLHEGRHRVARFDPDRASSSSSVLTDDVQHVPVPLEEVFNLASVRGSRRWVGAAQQAQFHGDVSDCDVDIVGAPSALRSNLKAGFLQRFSKEALPASDKTLRSFPFERLRYEFLLACRLTSAGLVRSLREATSLLRTAEGVSTNLLFGSGPSNTGFLGDVGHGYSGDAITGSDTGRTLSQAVGFSDIQTVRVIQFSGHVYNLDTEHGWYEANGIVAHNCPVNPGTKLEMLAKSLTSMQLMDDAGFEKALAMGSPAPGFTAPTGPQSGDGAGQVLATESLESDEKDLTDRKRKAKKKLSKSEAFALLRAQTPASIPDETLEGVVDLAVILGRRAAPQEAWK